jgi:amino acid adenylation domain-containing protein
VLGEQRWNYGHLNGSANQLARHLRTLGVGPEIRVGICLERSPELIQTVLAVWKAGGAYVPLDATHLRTAQQRVKHVLQEAQVSLVVTDTALHEAMDWGDVRCVLLDGADADKISCQDKKNLFGNISAEHLAYVLYTSGSTGQPKGVMVTHGNLANARYGWETEYRLADGVRSHLQMASFGFDVFAGDVVRALGSGGKLVLCPKEILLDAAELTALIRREQVEAAEFVPLVLRNLMQYLEETRQTLDSLRLVIAGSDAWYAADHRAAQRIFGTHTRLVNSYGLTETTIDSTYFEGGVEKLADTAQVPIGRPFPNVRVYVLDSEGSPTPPGVAGELYIGGDGVARGYVNPEQNVGRFVADPFSDLPGARLYRTGDRARCRADGQFEFLGRVDEQVKIRGYRVEPGEVEQLLREHPSVARVAVVARERTADDLRLVAYMVATRSEVPSSEELQEFLAPRIPEYMIPTAFVTLDDLPTTVSGKIDRRRLPEPDWSQAASQHHFVAPRTAIEQQLAEIWREILSVEQISVFDDFFRLGGNSLLALRLVSRVRAEFSVELPLVHLFTSPRLSDVAARIAALQDAATGVELTPVLPRPHLGPVPIAYGQRRFWASYRRFSTTQLFHQHVTLAIRGSLDVKVLQAAVNEIVRRHETLRTAFVACGSEWPLQVVVPEPHVELPVEDLSHLTTAQRDEEVQKRAQAQFDQRFDLGEAPQFRVRLLRLGPQEHALLATTHHIISDGWSVQLLPVEVAMIYDALAAGRPSPLTELPIQYADYSEWQREYLQGATLENLLNYWRTALSGFTSLPLPTNRPWRDDISHIPHGLEFHLCREFRSRLEDVCRAEKVTMFMLLVAAYQVLLREITGTDDVAVMFNASNRQRAETQGLIGMFTNPLGLRSKLSGDSPFRQVLAQVRRATLEALNHQELPWELMLADLRPDDDLSRFHWMNVYFGYHQPTSTAIPRGRSGLEITLQPAPKARLETRFALALEVSETSEGLHGEIEYDSTLFDEETIAGWRARYLSLLDAILDEPDQRLSELSRRDECPASPIERQLITICREILNLDQVRSRDNFFDLGGNSLLALRLVSRIRTDFQVELPLVDLFTSPDLAGFADRIVELQASSTGPALPPIERRTQTSPVPLSYAQEASWNVKQLFPGTTIQMMHAAFKLTGVVDMQALQGAIHQIVRRHETLRSTFHADADGIPWQRISTDLPIDLPVEDLSHLPGSEAEQQARRLSQQQAQQPFDLSRLPLFRLRLLRLDSQTHWLVVTADHLILDGWSLQILMLELAQIYDALSAGRPSPLPELPVQYGDYVLWQRERLQGPAGSRLRDFWHRQLIDLTSPKLPLDRPWRADSKHIPATLSFHINTETQARLRKICRAAEVTPFVFWLTTFKVLLHRYSGNDRIAVDVPVANRLDEATQQMIGLFVNAVVMQSDLSGNPTFREALQRVRHTATEAYDHQEMPFELLAREVHPDRNPLRFPLVQVMFNYHQRVLSNRLEARSELSLEIQPTDSEPGATRCELTLTIADTDQGFDGQWSYDSSLFDPATIAQIDAEFRGLLDQLLDAPDRPLSEYGGGKTEPREPLSAEAHQSHLLLPEIGRSLVPLRNDVAGSPLFCIHGLGGHVGAFLPLARQLSPARPVYGLQALGLQAGEEPQTCFREMATYYRREIQNVQAEGPFFLAGWSLGGIIALELAQQLVSSGQDVAMVALLDCYMSVPDFGERTADSSAAFRGLGPRLGLSPGKLKGLPLDQQWQRIAEQAELAHGIDQLEIHRLSAVCQAQLAAVERYQPQPYGGPVVLFRTGPRSGISTGRWRSLCPGLRVELVPGDHYSMLEQPHVAVLAQRLGAYLRSRHESQG